MNEKPNILKGRPLPPVLSSPLSSLQIAVPCLLCNNHPASRMRGNFHSPSLQLWGLDGLQRQYWEMWAQGDEQEGQTGSCWDDPAAGLLPSWRAVTPSVGVLSTLHKTDVNLMLWGFVSIKTAEKPLTGRGVGDRKETSSINEPFMKSLAWRSCPWRG